MALPALPDDKDRSFTRRWRGCWRSTRRPPGRATTTRTSRRCGACRGPGRARPVSRRARRAGCGARCARAASRSSTATRPKRSATRSPGATSSSSRRPPRARRSATTRRCSTASCATHRRARCICFRPRRWRRTSSPSCIRWRQLLGRRRAPTRRSACSPTTATRRRTRAAPSRSRAHVVLSNPDMLHSGILPHHPRWAKLFENLRFVVIDELHAYRGVFGSHLANIIRRLRRVCRHYGSDPDLHLLVGDDCESAGAGRAADRRRRSRSSTAAARRAARSTSSS